MPRKYELTWDGSNRRWRVMHAGKRYVVSCRQLKGMGLLGSGAPETKESSYKAANDWWQERMQANQTVTQPDSPLIEELSRRRDWSRLKGETGQAADFDAAISEARRWTADDLQVDEDRQQISLPLSGVWDRIATPS